MAPLVDALLLSVSGQRRVSVSRQRCVPPGIFKRARLADGRTGPYILPLPPGFSLTVPRPPPELPLATPAGDPRPGWSGARVDGRTPNSGIFPQRPRVLGWGQQPRAPVADTAEPLPLPAGCWRAPGAGRGGGGPRAFSSVYCLLSLQIQASAAPSGSRGFALKVSSCVLFSASCRHPSVVILGFSIPPPSSAPAPVLRWLRGWREGLVCWAPGLLAVASGAQRGTGETHMHTPV